MNCIEFAASSASTQTNAGVSCAIARNARAVAGSGRTVRLSSSGTAPCAAVAPSPLVSSRSRLRGHAAESPSDVFPAVAAARARRNARARRACGMRVGLAVVGAGGRSSREEAQVLTRRNRCWPTRCAPLPSADSSSAVPDGIASPAVRWAPPDRPHGDAGRRWTGHGDLRRRPQVEPAQTSSVTAGTVAACRSATAP